MAGSAGSNTNTNPANTTNTRIKVHSKSPAEAEPSVPAKTTVRPGKRRHQSSTPPVTARSESRSPRAKQRPVISRQSPPTISAAPVTAATSPVAIPVTSALQRSDSSGGSVSPSQLAVPRVSAEPPCPSKLPPPPVHWMAVEDKDPAQRKHCRAVTESLLSHLTSSGILVKA